MLRHLLPADDELYKLDIAKNLSRLNAKAGFCCAPGMGNDLAVKVRYRLGSRNC